MSENKKVDVWVTIECSECGEQQCRDDFNCEQCDKDLSEDDSVCICTEDGHFCDDNCYNEWKEEQEDE